MGPSFKIELKRAPHLVLAFGFMDRRSVVLVLWPFMLRVGWFW